MILGVSLRMVNLRKDKRARNTAEMLNKMPEREDLRGA